MAVSATHLYSNDNPTDGTSFVTGDITVTGGKLVLVAVALAAPSGTAADIPTLSGLGTTWTQVATRSHGSANFMRLTLFRGVPPSGTTGALTISTTNTHTWFGILVTEFSGVDLTTNQGVVQSASAYTNLATSLTVTLAAFSNANNATYGCFEVGTGGAGGTFVAGTGFTLLGQTRYVGAERNAGAEFRSDPDTSVDISLQGTANQTMAGIAVELAAQTGFTVSGQVSTETDQVLPGQPEVRVGGTLANELDRVLSGGPVVALPGALAGETDVLLGGSPVVTVSGQVSTETDQVLPGQPEVRVGGTLANELDRVLSGGPVVALPGALAGETDVLLGGSPVVTVSGQVSTETDQVLPGQPEVRVGGTLANELDRVLSGGPVVALPGALAGETDVLLGGSPVVTVSGQVSTETDQVLPGQPEVRVGGTLANELDRVLSAMVPPITEIDGVLAGVPLVSAAGATVVEHDLALRGGLGVGGPTIGTLEKVLLGSLSVVVAGMSASERDVVQVGAGVQPGLARCRSLPAADRTRALPSAERCRDGGPRLT
ncbi:MAG: hypothetical protein KatS3mg014_2537 [Actinomycetota bacterium]|nr:MAG: hypothetical protein KatS3mg014_2468 [Actinomycetota bacterium]GIV00922.1 MAG: hypothetical protein KatS3mg014_2537 [Actinomycetota bacterium]